MGLFTFHVEHLAVSHGLVLAHSVKVRHCLFSLTLWNVGTTGGQRFRFTEARLKFRLLSGQRNRHQIYVLSDRLLLTRFCLLDDAESVVFGRFQCLVLLAALLCPLEELVCAFDLLNVLFTPNTAILKVVNLGRVHTLLRTFFKLVLFSLFVALGRVVTLLNQAIQKQRVVASVIPLFKIRVAMHKALVRLWGESCLGVRVQPLLNSFLLRNLFLPLDFFFRVEDVDYTLRGWRSHLRID